MECFINEGRSKIILFDFFCFLTSISEPLPEPRWRPRLGTDSAGLGSVNSLKSADPVLFCLLFSLRPESSAKSLNADLIKPNRDAIRLRNQNKNNKKVNKGRAGSKVGKQLRIALNRAQLPMTESIYLLF